MNIVILGDGLLGTELHKQTGWSIYSRKIGNFDIEKIDETLPICDILINCIAHTDTYSSDRDIHWKVNYEFVSNLVDFCNSRDIKLVHISTDYLYSYSNPLASEKDVPVHCNNWYGYTKLLGDGHVQLKSKNYLIIRCSHKKRPFQFKKAWINQIGNFDFVDTIVSHIVKLVLKNSSGIYNVGTSLKTIYDLAKESNPSPIFKPDYVPSDISMNLTKLENS